MHWVVNIRQTWLLNTVKTKALSVNSFLFLLENATLEIQKQDVDRKRSHRQILDDLSNIRNKAQEVWNKIGECKWLS